MECMIGPMPVFCLKGRSNDGVRSGSSAEKLKFDLRSNL